MNTVTKRVAWQPLTPRGVAAFAEASFDRFQLAKLLVAIFCSCSVAAFLWKTCSPVIRETIKALPESVRLENGELKGVNAAVLEEGQIVSLMVDPQNSRILSPTKDVQINFGRTGFEICILRGVVGPYTFGCVGWLYQPDWNLPLGRSVLEPWWGAWHGMIFAAIGLAVFLVLVISWVFLAMLYTFPVRVYAFVMRRKITWSGSWRLAGAALMPGAIFLALGFWAYAFFLIDLVRFILIFLLHFVIGWVYLVTAPLTLDRLEPGGNKAAAQVALELKQKGTKNPFIP